VLELQSSLHEPVRQEFSGRLGVWLALLAKDLGTAEELDSSMKNLKSNRQN